MTDATEALLPCPFCAGKAELVEAKECGPGAYVVCCTGCNASSMVSFAVKDDPRRKLREAWNRRANHDDTVERCAQIVENSCGKTMPCGNAVDAARAIRALRTKP